MCTFFFFFNKYYFPVPDSHTVNSLSVGFSRQEYWIGLPFPFPGDLPNPGITPSSPALQADSLTPWATKEAYNQLYYTSIFKEIMSIFLYSWQCPYSFVWLQTLVIWTQPMFQTNIHWIIEKSREFQEHIYFCFVDYVKAFDCVDHNKLWKILQEMGIPDHLTCLLRNLYADQEATVRAGHGTTDWFQIGKGVRQVCICHPAYLTYMQSTSWEILGWMKHKLESRLQGEKSITWDV